MTTELDSNQTIADFVNATIRKQNPHVVDFVIPGSVSVVIDGQWGSTGKGLLAAFLAENSTFATHVATTNAGPNAGHTTCYENGRKFVTYHLPTIAVVQGTVAYVNAGSIVDIELLQKEIANVGFDTSKLRIHPRAVVVTNEHKLAEQQADSSATKLASTQKGVGAALADKVMRSAKLAQDYPELAPYVSALDLNNLLDCQGAVTMEIPQGMDLGLNHGHSYPTCTSREVSVAQGLSDANIHPRFLGKVAMSVRSYPIRVGNIVQDDVVLGQSGGCYDDQREVTWEELGLPPELTTVTKRVRRIFTWSNEQYRKSLLAIRPDIVFCNFLNYHRTYEEAIQWKIQMRKVESELGWYPLHIYGIGPNVEDVMSFDEACDKLYNTKSGVN